MKNTFIIIALFFSLSAFAQIEIKDVTLGKKLNVEHTRIVTLGGITMGNICDTLNDGRVYLIVFIPSDETGEQSLRINDSDVETIKNGLATKYNLNFLKYEEKYTNNYMLKAYKENVVFLIDVKPNQFMSPKNQVYIAISSQDLYEISQKEKQAEANKDF